MRSMGAAAAADYNSPLAGTSQEGRQGRGQGVVDQALCGFSYLEGSGQVHTQRCRARPK